MSALLALTTTLVFCAPGYPGATEDAQPLLDAFASVTASAAAWPAGSLAALYDPSEEGGLQKLARPEVALALVPFPFYVRHAAELRLAPLAEADVVGVGPEQRWTLVARRGQPAGAALRSLSIVSVAGYSPEFVRGYALAAWPLPPETRIAATGQVLGALRRVVAGDPVAVLLDQEATHASASLPFASELQQLTSSAPLPVAIVAVVEARLPKARAAELRTALLGLGDSHAAAAALAGLKLKRFVPAKLPLAVAP
jgi:hypothetical protein